MSHRSRRTLTRGTAAAALALAVMTGGTSALGVQSDDGTADRAAQSGIKDKNREDDFAHPLGNRERENRQKAVAQVLAGKAKPVERGGSKSIKVAKDEYVAYDAERTADVFTVLTEFGTQTKTGLGGDPGPEHDQIKKPDRKYDGNATDDNSTYWTKSFDRAHYLTMMFAESNSFKDFYLKQSNGRFRVQGDVSDWVKVPFNEARYGSNENPAGESEGYWNYVKDSITAWYADQKSQGKTAAQIKGYLAQFDVYDRYDFDNDGVFEEPDGYIDHFQAIHAGEGEEAGGGAQGEDAIWSHRWYAFATDQGKTGPQTNPAGGAQIGDTGIWVGDYTTEPENGGLGVFTHEFGHDLGLPDLYDTAGGDNGTGFWTLMSSGSWLNTGKQDIGTKPGYMGAWEKLQMGWLDHTTVDYGKNTKITLDPASAASPTTKTQAVAVNLPDKQLSEDLNTPRTGTKEFWSGKGNGLDNTMSTTVDLTGKKAASLSASVELATEADYDYLWTEASKDGKTWTKLDDGLSGTAAWSTRTWDLTPFVGGEAQVRFRYQTDTAVAEDGAFVDDVVVTADGAEVLADGAENGVGAWVLDGFSIIDGTYSRTVPQYYLAENRTYDGYDTTLKTGPYNFGYGDTKPDWVERYPYQNGLLVTYANGEFEDNNTSTHPGGGQVLPVDARPAPLKASDGFRFNQRAQSFDATFGLEATDEVVLHHNGTPRLIGERPGVATFNDADPNRYWRADNPTGSTKVAGSGTRISVLRSLNGGDRLQLQVAFTKK
ncbi:MAG: immune inhibitor A [Nocardioidaceae bacterium]|nr:immune inhibitor A [Nocardioidaceae bacterium]